MLRIGRSLLRASSRRTRSLDLVSEVRQLAQRYQSLSPAGLRGEADRLREYVMHDRLDEATAELFVRTTALCNEALRRTIGYSLYDVQIAAAWSLVSGNIAEMQTGEGKTLAALPAAAMYAWAARGVHVATPNSYLAQRDRELAESTLALLGLTVGLVPEGSDATHKSVAYDADITYSTGYELGFDYLRDQLAKSTRPSLRLGESTWHQLTDQHARPLHTIQRGLCVAMIDEIDHVLLDDALSPLILSESLGQRCDDVRSYALARDVARRLRPELDYRLLPAVDLAELTPAGNARVHDREMTIPWQSLQRSWATYIEQALRAEYLLRRDVHYVVHGESLRIIDPSTGRLFADRTWREGLHQAVQCKEGLPIDAEAQIVAQITRQRFFRHYRQLCGMTGTAQGSEREFRHVYQLGVEPIPLRSPCRRHVLPTRFFDQALAKWEAIVRDAVMVHRSGRPLLIGTRSVLDSERVADRLRSEHCHPIVLNGRQDAEEAQVIAQAGQLGAITVATDLAGRGTDIRLSAPARERGGLHVIVAECHESPRIDRQLMGRCARQGDPGSAQIFLAADDSLVVRFGAWLQRPLRRWANRHGEVDQDLHGALARLQRLADRHAASKRAAMFRRDREGANSSGAASE